MIKIIIITLSSIFCITSYSQVRVTGKANLTGKTSIVSTNISTPSLGATSTQMNLPYATPDNSVCSIEVSESPTYSPLIDDVNPALFTNSNLDNRTGNLGTGTTARVFVIGSRIAALALDSTIHSRALQAYTSHYYRITCNSTTWLTGTFLTANIPVGSTYNEPYPSNPAVPGGWLIPTITGIRTQAIIDPLNGMLWSPVSIPADHISGTIGLGLGSGSRQHNSNLNLHANIDGLGNPGYLLNLDANSGYFGLFTHVPATGASKALGIINLGPYVSLDDDLKAYNYNAPNTTVFNYIGAYAARDESAGQRAQFDGGSSYLTTDIPTLIHNFDSTFDLAIYGGGCSAVHASPGTYTAVTCLKANQDSYGWYAVFDGTTKTIVAAWDTYHNQNSKNCAIHDFVSLDQIIPNVHVASIYFHNLVHGSTTLGYAAVETTLASGINLGDTQLTVTSAPASQASGGDPNPVPTVTVGDVFRMIEGGQSYVHTITGLSGTGNHIWDFAPPAYAAVAAGGFATMDCNAKHSLVDDVWAPAFWDYLNDPHGTDTTNTKVIYDIHKSGGGHNDFSATGYTEETTAGWGFSKITGSFLASLNQPEIGIDKQVGFAGVTAPAPGVTLTLHPSIQQTTTDPFFLDFSGFNGGACCSYPVNDFFYGKRPFNTYITAAINSSQTTVPVSCNDFIIGCTQFPVGLIFRIDSELFLITSNGGTTTPTVTRGFYGTTAASHLINATFVVNSALKISGNLYVYLLDANAPYNILHRKVLPTQASSGGASLFDISGPSSIIGDTTGYDHQYCVAYIAGECVATSRAGDVFFNLTTLTYPWCTSTSGPSPQAIDICILDMPAFSNTINQFYMGTSGADALNKSRTFSAMAGIKDVVGFPLAKATPDAKYVLTTIGAGYVNSPSVPIDVWKIKLTPLPIPDGINRTTFIPFSVSFSSLPVGTAKAAVKFWYNNGPCGTRAEDCYATSSSIITGNDPYSYPTDSFTGTACTVSCSVVVPALSQRMLYYQKKYYNSSNTNIADGPIEVQAIQ